MSIIGAEVSAGELAVSQACQQFDQDGRLADPQLRHRLAELIAELVDAPTGVET